MGDSRCQEFRSSPFWPAPLFRSQLVKGGEEFLLTKGTPKVTQGFGHYQNKPFRSSHNKKRGSYRKCPFGRQSTPSSNQKFSSGRGKAKNRGVETPPPNDYLKASLSPPVGGCFRSFRRDWLTNSQTMC